MKAILGAFAIILLAGAAAAQSESAITSGAPNLTCHSSADGGIGCFGSIPVEPRLKLPLDTTQFICKCGPDVNEHFALKNDSLIMTQTGDVWTLLQNNQIGIVATSSMAQSHSGQQFKRDNVGFWSIAINRRTGSAVQGSGTANVTHATVKGQDVELPALQSYSSRGICTPVS